MLSKLEQTKQNLKVKKSTHIVLDNLLDNFDPEILEFIVVLNHLGFNTFSSCQGHIEEGEAKNFCPFIMCCSINAEEIPHLEQNPKVKEIFLTEYPEMLKIQAKLIDYLDEFYLNSNTPMRNRLIMETAYYCRTVITPYFSVFEKTIESKEERGKLNKIFLKEMRDFTSFLKSKI